MLYNLKKAGEHYAITVEVIDSGGKSSQGVIEVRITPEPNLRGPRFLKFLYEAQISEAANKFATLISTEAIDPEGDLVRYAIGGIFSIKLTDSDFESS